MLYFIFVANENDANDANDDNDVNDANDAIEAIDANVADGIERSELNIDDDLDSQQSVDDRKTADEKCPYCKLNHNDNDCPITTADMHIGDAVNYSEWCTEYDRRMKRNLDEQDEHDEEASSDEPDEDLIPYSEASLPSPFEIKAKNSKRLGVFAKQPIPKYQRLGPLQGLSVDESNISDDSTLENVIEINDGYKSSYFNLDDDMKSNWLKYVRPAPSINDRNTVLVLDNEMVYYVTCKDIPSGAELLYWSDKCNSRWKKNLGGKTSECWITLAHNSKLRSNIFHSALSLQIVADAISNLIIRFSTERIAPSFMIQMLA